MAIVLDFKEEIIRTLNDLITKYASIHEDEKEGYQDKIAMYLYKLSEIDFTKAEEIGNRYSRETAKDDYLI